MSPQRCTQSLGLLWLLVAAVPVTTQAKCKLELLVPKAGVVRVGSADVILGEEDNPTSPTAWQGPLVAGACKFNLGIIENPLALANGRLLYVPTYSGNMRQLALVDLQSCSQKWTSGAFSGELNIGADLLRLGDQRIALDANCVPIQRRK
jgi:hypothetical protein